YSSAFGGVNVSCRRRGPRCGVHTGEPGGRSGPRAGKLPPQWRGMRRAGRPFSGRPGVPMSETDETGRDDTGRAVSRAAADEVPLGRGLSTRLLFLTILFVMLAEVLIFLPSVASFRL